MMRTFDGKVALVTGGGSGIGRATSLTFAREGATVVVADANAEGGEETVRMIQEAAGTATFVYADVSKAFEVEALVTHVVEVYGTLDCAFNNAGISGGGHRQTHEYPEEVWDQVISINLTGVWLCMKYEIPQMLKQRGGVIVNTASIAGLVGSRMGSAAYSASKHGVIGLTKTAALEYATQGIRVNCVCPGVIRSPMSEPLLRAAPEQEREAIARHPIGRLGHPQEIAEVVVWLCSEAAAFVTGHPMVVDGGLVAQ